MASSKKLDLDVRSFQEFWTKDLLVLLWGEVYRLKSPTKMQGEVYRLTRTYRGANRMRFGLRFGLGLEPLP